DSTRLVPAALSRYVERHLVFPAPATDPDGFVAALAALGARQPGIVCLPQEDPTVALVAEARARLGGGVVPPPPADVVAVALDKHATAARAAALGIAVPRTVLPAGPDDLAGAQALDFPVVVKPRRAWGSQGFTVVDRPDDLRAAYARVHAVFPRPLVQE